MTEAGYLLPDEAPTHDDVTRTGGPVLLEFGTDWCGHCRALAPQVKRLLEAHPGVRHVKVEDGSGRPLGRAFKVKLWPNLVFLKDGAVVRQLARPSNQDLRDAFAALSS
jgi:thioredoxin 1